MQLHVDGDLLVYRCGFAAERGEYEVTLPNGECRVFTLQKELKAWLAPQGLEIGDVQVEFRRNVEPVENALHNVRCLIEKVEQQFPGDYITVYLSGEENFRDEIAVTREYKGNRDKDHKPVHGPAIKEYIQKHYETVISEAEEADDTIGWSHYSMYVEDPWSTVVVSVDKDLDMIPGLHFNFLKENPYLVEDDTAIFYFWRQMLTGDSTDNIPGISGIGEKRAEAILKDIPWENVALAKRVKQAYKDAFKADWRDRMLEFGRLLWIRRHQDEMWTIPKEIDE